MANARMLCLVALSAGWLAACTPVRVASRAEPYGVDFGAYRTYAVTPTTRELASRDSLLRKLLAYAADGLPARGLHARDSSATTATPPDVWLDLRLGRLPRNYVQADQRDLYVQNRVQNETNVSVHTDEQDVIVLALIDQRSRRIVWQAQAQGILRTSRGYRESDLQAAMRYLLREYPPR